MATIPLFTPSGLSAKQSARKFSGQDRNFDGLADRFKRKIYGGLKGDIRIAILQRDLNAHILSLNHQKPLRILDAGGGQGQFSFSLAAMGHHVTLCDISADMLALAAEELANQGLEGQVEIRHQSIQSMARSVSALDGGVLPFDLVLCHAVLEWVVDPELLLNDLTSLLIPNGYLSLTFYNENSVMMKNLVRGKFNRILQKRYAGLLGSLTPTQPLSPDRVNHWLEALPFDILCRSGIRCFHDYILDPVIQQGSPEELLELEMELSQREPFLSLARYIHVLGKKLG